MFFPSSFLQQPFGRPCPFLLKALTKFEIPISQAIEMGSRIIFSITVCSNILYSQVNAREVHWFALGWFR
jgi:hypothetical protein